MICSVDFERSDYGLRSWIVMWCTSGKWGDQENVFGNLRVFLYLWCVFSICCLVFWERLIAMHLWQMRRSRIYEWMQDLSDPTDLGQGTMSSSNKVDILDMIISSWYGTRYNVKQSWYLRHNLTHVTEVGSWVSSGQYHHKQPHHSQESEVSEVSRQFQNPQKDIPRSCSLIALLNLSVLGFSLVPWQS